MKILLAVDGSAYTKKMLAYLATHIEMLAGHNEFTALTVMPALPPRARAALSKEMVDGFYTEGATKVLDPVAKFMARHAVKLKTVHKTGPAGETIARYAEAGGYDLIMMGSHGQGALANLVMGSVTTNVLAQCSVPLLIVR